MKDLVALPVDEAVAGICRGYLKTARRALSRVQDPEDDAGLHDFRVALRRMRSCLRSYRHELRGDIAKKHYQQLAKLADRTNEARDVEVALAWLDEELPKLGSRQQQGGLWWRQRLERQHRDAYEQLEVDLGEAFNRVARPLDKRLKQLTEKPAGKVSFAEATAKQLRQLEDELEQELDAIRTPADVASIHHARIIGKRLRYLLEPPGKTIPVCSSATSTLRRFQDLLGNLHDCSVRQEVIRQVILDASVQWGEQRLLQPLLEQQRVSLRVSTELPGLLALARRNHSISQNHFLQLERSYLKGGRKQLMVQLHGAIEALDGVNREEGRF